MSRSLSWSTTLAASARATTVASLTRATAWTATIAAFTWATSHTAIAVSALVVAASATLAAHAASATTRTSILLRTALGSWTIVGATLALLVAALVLTSGRTVILLGLLTRSSAHGSIAAATRATRSARALVLTIGIVVLLGLVLLGQIVVAASSWLATTTASASATTTTSAALATPFSVLGNFLALTVLLDFGFVNGLLVADVFLVELLLAQHDFEHCDHASELEVVKTLL